MNAEALATLALWSLALDFRGRVVALNGISYAAGTLAAPIRARLADAALGEEGR
jgi:hypothetical protein